MARVSAGKKGGQIRPPDHPHQRHHHSHNKSFEKAKRCISMACNYSYTEIQNLLVFEGARSKSDQKWPKR
jgi:hypothetical protein